MKVKILIALAGILLFMMWDWQAVFSFAIWFMLWYLANLNAEEISNHFNRRH